MEGAYTDRTSSGDGAGYRLEFRDASGKAQNELRLMYTGKEFNNSSAGITSGRQEVIGRNRYEFNTQSVLSSEIRFSEGFVANDMRYGASTDFEQSFNNKMKVLLGIRYGRDKDCLLYTSPSPRD